MKYALLIGNTQYTDQKLVQLKAPEADARALARVLKSKKIGNFDEVTLVVNQTESKSRRAISAFLAKKKPDDLVLLYFSGHGILDDRGLLYLALKDTQLDLLTGTSLPSSFVTNEMDRCRSKRQILILDCCHSGAFARGAKGQQKAITETTFEGTGFGRVILTASDSTQYALEGDQVIQQSELSLFTHFLLEGLKTGEADRNNDGKISLDEWYDYCYSKVIGVTPQQVPHKWSYNQQGDLVIAQNPFVGNEDSAAIPGPLRAMLDQKQLDYQKHGLLLNSKELGILGDELTKTNFVLTDADKQLLLFSAVIHEQVESWLEFSGGKAFEWLRQGCLDENCSQELRRGAAASLGRIEDQQTLAHLLDYSQKETDLAKRNKWLDLLTHYLNRSEKQQRLPWHVHRTVFSRLAQLRIKEAAKERARMSRVAAYLAPVCVLITYASIMLVLDPKISMMTALLGAVFNIIIGMILAIAFAQVMTSLTFIRYGLPRWSSALIIVGVGSAFGLVLFLTLASYIHVWFAGGIIGLALAGTQPGANHKMAVSMASLFAILTFMVALLVLEMKTSVDNVAGYAFSVSLFVGVYIFQHIRGSDYLNS